MALLLNQIAWAEPVLPAEPDAAWEAELKRRGARAFEVDRWVASSPWLREAAYAVTSYVPSVVPLRLFHIGAMVTAQENACRYCYGSNRAYLKILGYPEAFIQRIERDMQMSELDDKERGFIAFCRNLARSRPRPSKAVRQALLDTGFSSLQVAEMTFIISMGCFYNRVSTLIACPPERSFERLANGPVGRLMALAAPLLRGLRERKKGQPRTGPDAATLAASRFGAALIPLAGLPGALSIRAAIEGAFESQALDCTTKALMFAVVARTLTCPHCESEASQMLLDAGMSSADVALALATLQSPRLKPEAAGLLAWTRETVSYDTATIQHKTRALAQVLDRAALLEAIGVASLANATVRLAMLQE